MTEKPAAEEYVYHIGKIRFIVTPVYKETGELMRDILLKLMLADLEPVYNFMRRRHTHV